MSGWTTLGELPAGTVFEFDDGDTRLGVVVSQLPDWTDWKQIGCAVSQLSHGYKGLRVRPLRLVRVGRADLERAFVAALVDDPQDGATLNAFADWLRDERREKDAANLQADWRGRVMDAVGEVVAAESELEGEHGREAGDYPRPRPLQQARGRHRAAWAELRRRLGVSDVRP